ncbi:hypothetical protein J6590_059526, partial [Homalodisca vitripennis]
GPGHYSSGVNNAADLINGRPPILPGIQTICRRALNKLAADRQKNNGLSSHHLFPGRKRRGPYR